MIKPLVVLNTYIYILYTLFTVQLRYEPMYSQTKTFLWYFLVFLVIFIELILYVRLSSFCNSKGFKNSLLSLLKSVAFLVKIVQMKRLA